MSSALAKPSSNQRQPSRPDSASSSIITVQRAGSINSRNGMRPPVSSLRSGSPYDGNVSPASFSDRALSPESQRRSSAVYNHPESLASGKEGNGSVSRWSQSTGSGKNTASHSRRGSFSRRLSGSFGSFGGFSSSQSPPPHRNFLIKSSPRENSRKALNASPPSLVPSSLPPIVTLPSLSQAVDAADSPSTAATATPSTADLLTPSTYSSGYPDYFGDTWGSRSPQKNGPRLPGRRTTVSPIRTAVPSGSAPASSETEGFRSPMSPISPHAARNVHGSPQRDARYEKTSSSPTRHPRNSAEPETSGDGVEGESSASVARIPRDKERGHKSPSQKAMLAKALQKANHAVLLDHAHNFEGAVDAYRDACALLRQVMRRSSGDDDRKKLDAIRSTYTSRIAELHNTNIKQSYKSADSKELPLRPLSDESNQPSSPVLDDEDGSVTIETARITRIINDPSIYSEYNDADASTRQYQPSERTSVLQASYSEQEKIPQVESLSRQQHREMELQPKPWPWDDVKSNVGLVPPMVKDYMPPPLSPRRPLSPAPPESEVYKSEKKTDFAAPAQDDEVSTHRHLRHETAESTSWLDTIDESGGSSASSVHSRTPSIGLRRRRIRAPSGATEAEFDAALDAAVEAAYDEGLEPADDDMDASSAELGPAFDNHNIASNTRKNIEVARQRVREAEREAALASLKDRETQQLQERSGKGNADNNITLDYSADEAEEEQRLVDEMTRDFAMDDSEYDFQIKSALPRQPDLNGYLSRSYGNSIGSNPTTANSQYLLSKAPSPPTYPPPSGALPPPPQPSAVSARLPVQSAAPTRSRPPSLMMGVRERRLSGQNVKQLKIETNTNLPPGLEGPKTQPPKALSPMLPVTTIAPQPKSASEVIDSQQSLRHLAFKDPTPTPLSGVSPMTSASPADAASESSSTPALFKVATAESSGSAPPMPASPGRPLTKGSSGPGTLRKNYSSSSLKNRIFSSSSQDVSGPSPNVSSNAVSSGAPLRRVTTSTVPPLPTGTNFSTGGVAALGLSLLDNHIHSTTRPGHPNLGAADPPLPLEPCPDAFLLRPFWMLRCVYQTIAHPHGGYMTTRLFVPRDIWQVKNVKLKSVEEKVSNLDLLTAALLNLRKVDTLDANAVLEEMQSLELILDQVQANLSKKVGSEVGMQGATASFKGANTTDEAGLPSEALPPRSTNLGNKSYWSSLRKLRNKTSSSTSLPSPFPHSSSKNAPKDTLFMATVPMTSLPNPRHARRDPSLVQTIGPHANYMGALARLCDAAQVIDQVARQVEDPGLKHSSPTHVGLELSTRHASEFFGFYVCRFVLADITLMLEKFVKRGGERVTA